MYTIENIKEFEKANEMGLIKGLEECKEVPDFMKTFPKIRAIYNSGSWLSSVLEEMGCQDKERSDIQFCHGQRCFGGDPYQVALHYANEYAASHAVKNKPGEKLANEIFQDCIKE